MKTSAAWIAVPHKMSAAVLHGRAGCAVDQIAGPALSPGLPPSLDVQHATQFETRSSLPFPDGPRFLVRLGAGVRYGHL